MRRALKGTKRVCWERSSRESSQERPPTHPPKTRWARGNGGCAWPRQDHSRSSRPTRVPGLQSLVLSRAHTCSGLVPALHRGGISFSLQPCEGDKDGETEAPQFRDLPKVMQLEMAEQRFEPHDPVPRVVPGPIPTQGHSAPEWPDWLLISTLKPTWASQSRVQALEPEDRVQLLLKFAPGIQASTENNTGH